MFLLFKETSSWLLGLKKKKEGSSILSASCQKGEGGCLQRRASQGPKGPIDTHWRLLSIVLCSVFLACYKESLQFGTGRH